MKRAILLLMILLSSTTHNTQLWAYSPTNPGIPPDGSYDNPFGISNVADINEFIDDINNNNTAGYYYRLTFDPPVVAVPWGTTAFKGYFDGGGHTIYLDINLPTTDYVGLFSSISDGMIHNLALKGSVVGHNYVGSAVGGVTGNSVSIVIDVIRNSANITGNSYVGGICGGGISHLNDLTQSVNIGRVVSIASEPIQPNAGNYVGGTIGYMVNGSLKSNINSGVVSGTDYVGGIVGYREAAVYTLIDINASSVYGDNYVGSIAGYSTSNFPDSCFYDKQMSLYGGIDDMDYPNSAEGWMTTYMLDNNLEPYFSVYLNYIYESYLYPRLDDHPISILAASPVYLSNGERYNYVKSDFSVSILHNVVWESVNGLVSIDNITGDVTILNIGNETLRAKLNDFVKEVDITIVP